MSSHFKYQSQFPLLPLQNNLKINGNNEVNGRGITSSSVQMFTVNSSKKIL